MVVPFFNCSDVAIATVISLSDAELPRSPKLKENPGDTKRKDFKHFPNFFSVGCTINHPTNPLISTV